jgi:hypothetical protein
MPSMGFEPKISAGERQQTYALDRVATDIGNRNDYQEYFLNVKAAGADNLTIFMCRLS